MPQTRSPAPRQSEGSRALTPAESVRGMLGGMQKRVEALAPKHLDSARILGSALSACEANRRLLEADPFSLELAVLGAASAGWEVFGPFAKAHLVPYKGKVQLIPGYRGVADVLYRSGMVAQIETRVVYEKDHIEINFGSDAGITHRPTLIGPRGGMVGVYAVITLRDGHKHIEWMSNADIDKVKASSAAVKAKRSSPWDDHHEEMARKTVLKRAAKPLPMSVEDLRVIEGDPKIEGIPERPGRAPRLDPTTAADHDFRLSAPAAEGAPPVKDVEPKRDEVEGNPEAAERQEALETLAGYAQTKKRAYADVVGDGEPAMWGLDQLNAAIDDVRAWKPRKK